MRCTKKLIYPRFSEQSRWYCIIDSDDIGRMISVNLLCSILVLSSSTPSSATTAEISGFSRIITPGRRRIVGIMRGRKRTLTRIRWRTTPRWRTTRIWWRKHTRRRTPWTTGVRRRKHSRWSPGWHTVGRRWTSTIIVIEKMGRRRRTTGLIRCGRRIRIR